jgi:YHS domain-containing protein
MKAKLAALQPRGDAPAKRVTLCCERGRRVYIIESTCSRRTEMEKDVVCGMQVDPAKAAGTSQYGGKTYYFCSKGCKAKFDANPKQYVK